jgi:M3 family oligoendopeptidase
LLAECLQAAIEHPRLPEKEPYKSVISVWHSRKGTTKEVTELFGEEQSLVAQYRELMGALKIEHDGNLFTLNQSLNIRKRSNDENQRRELWFEESAARGTIHSKIDDIALELVKLRQRIAHKSGFDTYTEYVFNRAGRFDYGPSELLETIKSIRNACSILNRQFASYKASLLNKQTLAPWDSEWEIQLDPSTPPSRVSERLLKATVSNVLFSIDPEFGSVAETLFATGAADLWQRAGKQAGAWSTYLSTTGQPLILTNNVGIPSDFRLTLHEMGHAIHFSYSAKNNPYWLQHSTQDVNEYMAYTIQCLGTRTLATESVMRDTELTELKLNSLMNALDYIDNLVAQEEFNHWVYSQPSDQVTSNFLDSAYVELTQSDALDWTGTGLAKRKMWQTQRFIPMPFYASEYILAWVMAMVTLEAIDQEPISGMQKLKQVMVHSEWGFKKVLSMWGVQFPFETSTLKKISGQLRMEFGFDD